MSLGLEEERHRSNDFEFIFISSAIHHPYEALPHKSHHLLKEGIRKGGRFKGKKNCEANLEVEVINFRRNPVVLCLFQDQWEKEDDVTKGLEVNLEGDTYEGSETLHELMQPVTGYVLKEPHSMVTGYIIESDFYGQVRVWEKVNNNFVIYYIEPWEHVPLYNISDNCTEEVVENLRDEMNEKANAILFEFIPHVDTGPQIIPTTPPIIHSTKGLHKETEHSTWYRSTKGKSNSPGDVIHSTTQMSEEKEFSIHSTTQVTEARTFYKSTKAPGQPTRAPVFKSTKGVTSAEGLKWHKSTLGSAIVKPTKRIHSTTVQRTEGKGSDELNGSDESRKVFKSTTMRSEKKVSEGLFRSTTRPKKAEQIKEASLFKSTPSPSKGGSSKVEVVRSTSKPKNEKGKDSDSSFIKSTSKPNEKKKIEEALRSTQKPTSKPKQEFFKSTKNSMPKRTRLRTTSASRPKREDFEPTEKPEPDPAGDFRTNRLEFTEVTSGFTLLPPPKERRRRKKFARRMFPNTGELETTTPIQVSVNELDGDDFRDNEPVTRTSAKVSNERMYKKKMRKKRHVPDERTIDDNDIVEEIRYLGGAKKGSVEVYNLLDRRGAYLCYLCIWIEPTFANKFGFTNMTMKYGIAEVIDLVRMADWIFRATDFNMDFIPENVGFGLREIYVKELTGIYKLSGDVWENEPESVVSTFLDAMRPLFTKPCCVFLAFVDKYIPGFGSITYRRGMCVDGKNIAIITGQLHRHKVTKFDVYRFLMHALGHLMGALNDDELDPDCNDEKPSLYLNPFIMHPAHQINIGLRRNSMRFSFCSRVKIAAFLSSSYAECLEKKEEEGGFCGNGIVEGDEECDCGTWQCLFTSRGCCGIQDGFAPCKIVTWVPRMMCREPVVWDGDLEDYEDSN